MLANYVATFTDISRIKQSESQLEHLAHHDPLTGLPNRLRLLSSLEHAIGRAERHGGRGAVLFLDLDRFKNVNDSMGHPAGDELLVLVARRLREHVPGGEMLARLGGDEFVVLMDAVSEPEAPASMAETLIAQFEEPFVFSGGRQVYVGASIGISVFPDDGDDPNVLIQHADAALYQAKESGRGTYRFYSEALTLAADARLEMETKLRRGLERNEFVLHYQPLLALADGRIIGMEALLRWQHPTEGLVMPDTFIPLAEETGLIVPLGEWALRSRLRAGGRMDRGGARPAHGQRQPVAPAAVAARPSPDRPRGSGGDRPVGRAPRARDHRKRAAGAGRRSRRQAEFAEAAGRAAGDRRFRDRLFLARLSDAPADRHA